jgi:hypothetical protein
MVGWLRIMMRHPKNTPLFEWPPGWLKMEVASLYNAPEYLVMTDDEKRKALMPVTDGEMREFIEIRREIDAARRYGPNGGVADSPSKGSEGPFRRARTCTGKQRGIDGSQVDGSRRIPFGDWLAIFGLPNP